MPIAGAHAKTEEERNAEKVLEKAHEEMSDYMINANKTGSDGTRTLSDAVREGNKQAAPETPDVYKSEYDAATTAEQKAQVAAKHGDFKAAFGNEQNARGELKRQVTDLESRYNVLSEEVANARTQAPPQQQQDPYSAVNNLQVVQPTDQYDTEAERMNKAFQTYSVLLGQGLQQQYGQTLTSLQQEVEGLKRMPSGYNVDHAQEQEVLSEMPWLSKLPEWQKREAIMRMAGKDRVSPTQTTQERKVQAAYNYVEPSDTSVNISVDDNSSRVKFQQEYDAINRDENDPIKRLDMRKKLMIKWGAKEIDDLRPGGAI